ncbi:MAG: hypothetical protein HYR88_14785 [Verrucomicrobia bacterium]|nr:hypothetical protein [Verrucomicrobiota bacterium]MBI3868411.1 hypothetical protein [Verrucomicrobiota bacterium]
MKKILLTATATATLVHASQLFAAAAPAPGYIAHEWGTFTSVQAADGKQMEWNPLTVSELPTFVYDVTGSAPKDRNANLRTFSIKSTFRTLQRMETPVIYFYADTPQTVDVSVKFPQGIVTEWYPQARALPKPKLNVMAPLRRELQWDRVQILPNAENITFPGDTSGSHYYSARETAANPVRIANVDGALETEKFLFYRGIGNFRAPLTVTVSQDGRQLTVKNEGGEPVRHAVLYQLQEGAASFQQIEALSPGETKTFSLSPGAKPESLGGLRDQVKQSLRTALVQAGLYEREAAAMVKTWDDSWLNEPGVRVLYTLSRDWTDRTLPLQLSPAPRGIARVMVGRAEVITPGMELSLLHQTERYVQGDAATKAEVVGNVRRLGFGRFLEPAMRRLVDNGPKNREFSSRSFELLNAASKTEDTNKPLAFE